MSKKIDERIVEMRFDNKDFEKNVKKTISSLDKLKEKLKFKNATDSLDSLQRKANSMSFEHLVKSVDKLSDTVQKRTGIIGGIFEELGSRIVGIFDGVFGKINTMINQITFDSIASGFSEYELKINSVQTIAANTGVLMRDVMNEMGDSGDALLESSEALELAWQTWSGAYGDGQTRVEALGENYEQVQQLVNKIARGELKMGESIESANKSLSDQEYTMEDIEQILDDLNTYADKTIYNYAQMTDAIGKFTVAGVDLYDSASAVQGIANLAAFVGANSQDTSRIMRELAQGLNTGYINLMDWRSLENSSGFSGTVFQEHLVDMAEHMYEYNEEYREYIQGMEGEVSSIQELIDTNGSFRNSLQERWLNADVLINTLHEFAGDWDGEMYSALGYTEQEIQDLEALGDVAMEAATKSKTFTQMWDAVVESAQSSWTESWEYIFGHFYDARNLWTDVSDALSGIISANNEARNEILKGWVKMGGRTALFSGFSHLFNFLTNISDKVKEAWSSIMPEFNAKTLTKMSVAFDKFALRLEKSEGTIDILKNIASALFTIIKAVAIISGSIITSVANLLGLDNGNDTIDTLSDITLYFSNMISSLIDLDTLSERSTKIFTKLFNILKYIPLAIGAIIVGPFYILSLLLGGTFADNIGFATDTYEHFVDLLREKSKILVSKLAPIKDFFLNFKDNISLDYLKTVGDKIKSFLSNLVGGKEIDAPMLIKIGAAIAQFVLILQGIKAYKKANNLGTIFDILKSIKGVIDSIASNAKLVIIGDIIVKVAASVLLLAAALAVLALIPADRLQDVISAFLVMIGSVTVMGKILSGAFGGLPNNSGVGIAASILMIALAINSLIASIIVLNIIDYNKTIESVMIIGTLMAMIAGLIKMFSHARFRGNLPSVSGAVFILTLAISSLAGLVTVLSIFMKFNGEYIWQATAVVGTLLLMITLLYMTFPKIPTGNRNNFLSIPATLLVVTTVLIALASFVAIMAVSLAAIIYFNVPIELVTILSVTIIGILISIGVLLAVLTKMTYSVTNVSKILAMAGAVALVAGVISSLVLSLTMLALIPGDKCLDIIGLYSVISMSLMGFMLILGNIKISRMRASIKMATSLTIITFAMMMLAESFAILSMMDFDPDRLDSVLYGTIIALGMLAIVIALLSKLGGSGNTITRSTSLMFDMRGSPLTKFLKAIALLILSISVSLWLVVESINILVEAAEKFGNDENMVVKIQNMFQAISIAFINSWKYISKAVENAGVGDDLEEWTKSLLVHIVNVIAYILRALVDVVGLLAVSLADIIIEVFNGLAGTDLTTWTEALQGDDSTFEKWAESFIETSKNAPINKLINALVAFVALVIYGLGDAIKNNSGPLVMAVAHLLKSLGYLLLYVAAAIISVFMPDFDYNMISQYINDLDKYWAETWINGFDDYILPALKTVYDKVSGFLWSGLFAPIYGIFMAIADVWNNIAEKINTIYFKGQEKVGKIDTTGMENIYKEMLSDAGFYEKQAESTAQAIDKESESLQNFTDKLNALNDTNKDIKVEATVKSDTFADDLFQNGQKTGLTLGKGVTEGVSDWFNSDDVKNKITDIKNSLPKINLSGLFDSTNTEYDSSLTNVNTFDGSSLIDDIMGGDFGNKFSNMDINMGSITSDLADMNADTNDMLDTVNSEGGKFYDDSDVVSELTGLRSDVNSLSDSMSNIKMYLDGNKLVGALVGPLDTALAQRATRTQRGN